MTPSPMRDDSQRSTIAMPALPTAATTATAASRWSSPLVALADALRDGLVDDLAEDQRRDQLDQGDGDDDGQVAEQQPAVGPGEARAPGGRPAGRTWRRPSWLRSAPSMPDGPPIRRGPPPATRDAIDMAPEGRARASRIPFCRLSRARIARERRQNGRWSAAVGEEGQVACGPRPPARPSTSATSSASVARPRGQCLAERVDDGAVARVLEHLAAPDPPVPTRLQATTYAWFSIARARSSADQWARRGLGPVGHAQVERRSAGATAHHSSAKRRS